MARRTCGTACAWIVLAMARGVPAEDAPAAGRPLEVEAVVAHGPQRPSAVPILPGLPLGKQWFYGPLKGRPAPGQGYQPADGDGFAVHNGPGVHHFILTSGMWWLRVGDRPRLHMELRSGAGAYASPALLPDLGVVGQFRLAVTAGGKTRWLDEFASIDAVLSPGSASWACRDDELGVSVGLKVQPLVRPWGFVAEADVSSAEEKTVTLAWHVAKATHAADREGYAEFTSGKFARIFAGAVEKGARAEKGRIEWQLRAAPNAPAQQGRLLCVWGYSDYNRQGVADAYRRLEFRPFDAAWLEGMKAKWFEHWIGGGLEPEKKFLDARDRLDPVIRETSDFWSRQRARLRVKTPDPRLDNVINHVAAQARVQFEYPGFMHGLGYAKYGKINHGYYGFEAAGMHDETADSLHFVAGTQDPKGRQRYFMTTFALSNWHEDMDFYFAEQCWFHWRWTGDREFLRAIWPAARRALEHGLAVSDPDGDGLMTGYYEMWNSDQNNPGGFSALQTAMAWAALRAGRDMAAALDDQDHAGQHGSGARFDPVYARRYTERMRHTEGQYLARLWQREAGAWSSAEHGGLPRPRPHTCEQNYAVWRGLGTPAQNYMAMRYVREELHRPDLIAGSTFEFINDWWPVQWSHHYVASGDTCASFHSACAAGDVDGHWPAFKTVAESAYSNGGTLWQGTGSNTMEMEPLFLAAVVDGLFGVKPWFGEDLLVLRPSPPTGWNDLELRHADVTYRFHRDAAAVRLDVATPVARRVRAELPVRSAVREVALGGAAAKHRLESAVNGARVVIESPPGREHHFQVTLAPEGPVVEGSPRAIVGAKADFIVRNAAVAAIHDPQLAVEGAKAALQPDGTTVVSFVPLRPGKPTVFVELQCSETRWLHPLDLDVRKPWAIAERYVPAFHAGGPCVASPAIDEATKTLTLDIVNGGLTELAGRARITVAGRSSEEDVKIGPSGEGRLRVPLESVWDRLSPGSLPVRVEIAGRSESAAAVCWTKAGQAARLTRRMRPIDLGPHLNADFEKLFSPATQWRTDYTGAQHGVDWRHPMPLRDERGYVLLNSVMSIFDYGVLPEQIRPVKRLKLARPGQPVETGLGVPFAARPGRLLAVCCTQPYEQFPGQVTLKLAQGVRAEKLYLLSANLVKTLKCYYPGAEIVVHYEDGPSQTHPMVPPYTMPSLVSSICPRAHAVRVGQLEGDGNPVCDPACYLSVTDVSLDPGRAVAAIELRCVATETLLGIAGLTLLEAE